MICSFIAQPLNLAVDRSADSPFVRLAVVGAGNMGAGIAQKMAMEGFAVTLVDCDTARVDAGLARIARTLDEGVGRGVLQRADADAAQARLHGTTRLDDLADADVVVEAVFEDLALKRDVFAELDRVCRPTTILGTNTSSFAVADLAAATAHSDRVVGLHYFFHPAKNRLVEVWRRAWSLQEAIGKTPIASRDSFGFVVNRFFAPWLVEAIRLLEEGVANIPTIEAAAKQTFGIGMGPFELMNVTGLPIALHTATTLGRAFGPLYDPPARLRQQVEAGAPWTLDGAADPSAATAVADRLTGVIVHVASALADEGVATTEDIDIGARVGLRWRRGPFELMNHVGLARAGALAAAIAERWRLPMPETLSRQVRAATPFALSVVRTRLQAGLATLTIDRPDAMNALNEAVVAQLDAAFRRAAADPAVHAIVIAGSGKAFVAGADIRLFLRHIDSGDLARIRAFTITVRHLLEAIASCEKPVIARVHGVALGGGVELALACHAIVASPKAVLALPETSIGIYPGLGGTQRTTRRLGTGLAKWLVLSGQPVNAPEALAIGLVDRVAPFEQLDATIAAVAADLASTAPGQARREVPASHAAIADFFDRHDADALLAGTTPAIDDERLRTALRRVSANAPIAVRLAAGLIDRGAALPLEAALALELDHLEEIFATRDARHGLSSLGRASPTFEGR
jgi:enoyl-CoA hydratase / 3-hydroxyacyl-CoA dehydrogenase